MLPSSDWYRCLRHLWGFACYVHLRLESYHYLVHHHLHIFIPSIVGASFYVGWLAHRVRYSGTSPAIGSVSKLYDLLEQASIETPVVGNQDGSYLTMKSNQGLVFGAVTILSGFTGVFCDQGWPFMHVVVRISLIKNSTQVTGKG